MYDETMFTTTDTGRPAPTWHQSFDGPRLFWRDDYWNHMQATAERRAKLTDDVAAAMLDHHLNTNVSIRISTKGEDVTPAWQQEKRTCAAPYCDRQFTPKNPKHVVCGAVKCQTEHKAAQRSKYNAKYDAKRKRTKAEVAP